MKSAIAIAMVLASLAATPARAMDVGAFLAKADALKQKGLLAPLSPDFKPMMAEINGASKALKAERLAAQAAGTTKAYCPTSKAVLSSDEIADGMRAIPAVQRSQIQVKDALRTLYARKYPCPA